MGFSGDLSHRLGSHTCATDLGVGLAATWRKASVRLPNAAVCDPGGERLMGEFDGKVILVTGGGTGRRITGETLLVDAGSHLGGAPLRAR